MACMYPLEQLVVGFISGGILSLAVSTMYYAGRPNFLPSNEVNRTEEEESDEETEDDTRPLTPVTKVDGPTNSPNFETPRPDDPNVNVLSDNDPVMTFLIPTLPNKSLIVCHITDETMEKIKLLSEELFHHKSQDHPKEEKVNDELEVLFNEAYLQQNKATKKLPSPELSVPLPSSSGTGYKKLEEPVETHDMPEGVLERGDEMVIINTFRHVVGASYHTALEEARNLGFNLHPLYVSLGPKMPLSSYSSKTIGVRISDPEFDQKTGTPSSSAKITEIIDVGGVDLRNVGIIKL
jgi:hypothetical protein